jgi:hypothetical protein
MSDDSGQKWILVRDSLSANDPKQTSLVGDPVGAVTKLQQGQIFSLYVGGGDSFPDIKFCIQKRG